MSKLNRSQSVTVVAQVINELEAQGLLMLFDPEEHVAKRLTGDLIAAGILQDSNSGEILPAQSQNSGEPFDC